MSPTRLDAPVSVLVADPSPDNADSLAAVLAPCGHRVRAAGFDHHFVKPADPAELVRAVGRSRPARPGGAVCTSS